MTKFIPGGPERFDHQKRGLKKLLDTGGVAALLFDPGLGKTATALDYCSILAMKLPPLDGIHEARVLVVAPLAAVDSWVIQAETYVSPQVDYWAEAIGGTILQRGEALAARGGNPLRKGTDPATQKVDPSALHVGKAHAWNARATGHTVDKTKGPAGFPGDRPRIILTALNIDTFSRRSRIGSGTVADYMLNAVKRFAPDLIIVDESHKLKTNSSNTSRLLGRIAQHSKRRMMLTGTVMPHGALDVFGQWRFLEPFAFGDLDRNGHPKKATFTGFKERYAQFGGFMGREVVGYKNLDNMQDIMAKNAIVARKEDSLDLPPTTDATVKVNLSPREAKAYADMKKALATKAETGELATAKNPLTQMMRLRQITSGHLPMDDGTVQDLGSSKANTIASLVNDTLLGEDRVVIFCLFTHEIHTLADKLKMKGTTVETISGDTPNDERIAIRKRFGSKAPGRIVLIAQIKTMSLAVNELVTASHAVYGSMSQQRDDYVQSRDRLNRLGQTRPVTYWHVEAPGTIDEVIRQSHQDRTNLESAVLAHIMESE